MNKNNVMMMLMVFLIGIVAVSSANAVLTDDLVAGWEMDEESNSLFADVLGTYGGTGYNGQAFNNSPVASNLLHSINMTTASSYIEMSSSTFADVATNNAFTYNTWITPETIVANPATMDLMFKQFDGTNGFEFGFLQLSNSSIGFFVFAGNTTNFVLNDGDIDGCVMEASEYLEIPRMVTVQFDGETLYVYYNNVLCGTVSGQLKIENNAGIPFRIGRFDAQNYVGLLDSTMLWSRNLTSTELTTLYNNGDGIPYPFNLQSNLLAYYKLDEGTGNAIDALGTYNVTMVGTVGNATGIINSGRNGFNLFETSSNYFGTNTFPTITETMPYTLSAWVKFSESDVDSSYFVRLGSLDSGGDYLITMIYLDTSDIFVCNSQKAGVGGVADTYSVVVNNDQWYHVVCTYDGAGDMTIYVDNVTGTNTESTTPTSTTSIPNIQLGSADNGRFNGTLDEVGIWTRELSASEVGELYNSGVGLSYPFEPTPTPESCAVCNSTCAPCGQGCTATDLTSMYTGVTGFDATYGNISGWDTSCITSLYNTFSGSDFNQDISGWNTSSVTSMSSTFYDTSYNRPLNDWDTSSVTQMDSMFGENYVFNQPLNNWDVSSVTTFGWMFGSETGNGVFNQDISSWDTSSATIMSGMFLNNNVFNQNIGGWDTSSVTEMYDMFNNATSFNRNIGLWDVSQVTDMTGMMENVNLSIANYDALLTGWSAQTLQNSVVFSAGYSQYSNCTVDEKAVLTVNNSWTVTDGGLNADYQCEPLPPQPTDITGAVTQTNNAIVSILVALIILSVLIGIVGLVLNHLGLMSKNVLMIMGAVLVALVIIILVLSFKMIGVV